MVLGVFLYIYAMIEIIHMMIGISLDKVAFYAFSHFIFLEIILNLYECHRETSWGPKWCLSDH